jgi:hypothetical protein
MNPHRKLILTLITLLLASTAYSQGQSCPAIVETALEAVEEVCADAGRNQACYGNVELNALPQPGVQSFEFSQRGDIVNVADVAEMALKPLNETAGTWGVALMRLQASLPDTLPGQNVTLLLFGDVSIAPNPDAEATSPMQAFYFRSGIGDAPCSEAPSSGIIVQTPEGATEVTFNINGVDVSMGSTVLLRAMPGEEMTVSALEGSAVINVRGELYAVIAGTWARLPIDRDLRILDAPALPTAYNDENLAALPLNLLARRIQARTPLTEEELDALHERLRSGEPPCGDDNDLFPRCENLPFFNRPQASAALRWAMASNWGRELPPRIPFEGRLLDVIQDGEVFILRDDDGTECILDDNKPAEEQRPLCRERLSAAALERIGPLIDNLRLHAERTPLLPPFIAAVDGSVITLMDGRVCERRDDAGDALPRCRDILTRQELQTLLNMSGDLPVDTRPCVYPPGPNDPPLPASETRPFCEQVVPGQNFPTYVVPTVAADDSNPQDDSGEAEDSND